MKEFIAGAALLVHLDLSADAAGNPEKRILSCRIQVCRGHICQGESLKRLLVPSIVSPGADELSCS